MLEILNESLNDRNSRIIFAVDTEVYRSSVRWVVLMEGGCETVVEVGVDAFYRADDGNMGSFIAFG
jgi:hypothetical protein